MDQLPAQTVTSAFLARPRQIRVLRAHLPLPHAARWDHVQTCPSALRHPTAVVPATAGQPHQS